MREKQRRADLKKQGIDPDAEENANKPKKQYDTSFMDQYNLEDDGEEEKKEEAETEEEPNSAAAAAASNQNAKAGKKKKNKNK